MRLNFTISELLHSDVANSNKINNIPTRPYVYDNLLNLIFYVLQPLRDSFGVIYVNSGYRCQKLNELVRGSNTSRHLDGMAVDIYAKNASLKELYNFITTRLDYDECFIETNKSGIKWLHVAYCHGNNRRKHNSNYLA